MVIIYVPFLHDAFGTYYLPLVDWLIIAGLAVTIVPVLEIGQVDGTKRVVWKNELNLADLHPFPLFHSKLCVAWER